jgi:hypothetical protein
MGVGYRFEDEIENSFATEQAWFQSIETHCAQCLNMVFIQSFLICQEKNGTMPRAPKQIPNHKPQQLPIKPMDGKVHLVETNGFSYPFLTINTDLIRRILPVLFDETGTLNEHTARSTTWAIDTAMKRLQYLHN